MTSMAAFRLTDWLAPPRLVEAPVPQPGPGQIRVRVAGCGLCHSDVTMGAMTSEIGDALGWQVPFTLGHEAAGWVDGLGAGVSGFDEGDAVVLASPASCGTCRWCRRGQENACSSGLAGRGYGRDGALAPYVLVDRPERALVGLHGSLDPTVAGPLSDAGATSHHAVARVLPHLVADSTVVVIGLGGLGGFGVQLLAALTEARIVAIDPDAGRRERADRFGADLSVDGVDEQTRSLLGDLVGPDPIDGVVDLVGTDATLALGAQILAPGGGWAVVGAGGGTLRRPWFSGLPRDAEVFTFQGSDLADLRAVVALADEGRIVVDCETFTLDAVAEAFGRLDAGTLAGRAVVVP